MIRVIAMSIITKSINQTALFRLFAGESATIEHSGDSLVLKLHNGNKVLIDYEKLVTELSFKRYWFFVTLAVPTEKGTKRLFGIIPSQAEEVILWLKKTYYERMYPDIGQASKSIAGTLAKGYLRTSRLAIIRQQAMIAFDRYKKSPEVGLLSDEMTNSYSFIEKIAHWSETDADEYRTHYVQRMKLEHQPYFNTIESYPLTEKQREACIVDDDNNMVLAGAGTGKTSVMIGRTGFLLKTQQAFPNEILMLAFARKAADEMQQRIDKQIEQKGVTVSTFHKLGKEIIAQVEGGQPRVHPIAEDEKLLQKKVNEWFDERIESKPYRKLVLKYFEHYLYPDANPFDFKTEGEYYEYIKANEIRTLKGELVKSYGECLIANCLFNLGVEYKYEEKYKFPTITTDYVQYCPDFYLPDCDLYIEYFGIDREENTASYVNKEEYLESMKWKRQTHREYETQLIELFHYDNTEGLLLNLLKEKIADAGAEFKPLSEEEKLATLRKFGAVSQFAKLMSQMLQQYRSGGFTRAKIEERIETSTSPGCLSASLDLLIPIVDDYVAFLEQEECIDFNDMINRALSYVEAGKFISPWKYILVDEFQDISEPRAKLVKALKSSAKECSLFCVGDDWQAIYRFTGSDIDFTKNFESHFGVTKFTVLDKTFRFNNSICDIGIRFIQKNPSQIEKNISTHKVVKSPAVSMLRETERKQVGATNIDKRLDDVLSAISARAKDGDTVYLLGRYGFTLPEKRKLEELRNRHPGLAIERYTIHATKGKESDYVVLLGLTNGAHGFPSIKTTHPLLEYLLPPAENFLFAEERRLFYVAITRARERVYLIVDMLKASEFIVELIKEDYPLEEKEFEVSLVQELFQKINCIKCITGSMVFRKRIRSTNFFLGCSNYPLCKHTEDVCLKCGQAMEHVEQFRVCINRECRNWVPKCDLCGADLVKRKGKYGEFWGCVNYRRDEKVSCDKTKNDICFDLDILPENNKEPVSVL